MSFVKMIIGLPLIVIIAVFAFVNNDMAVFSLWPFNMEITVSLSVAVIFFSVFGYIVGKLDSWLSYAPLRQAGNYQLLDVFFPAGTEAAEPAAVSDGRVAAFGRTRIGRGNVRERKVRPAVLPRSLPEVYDLKNCINKRGRTFRPRRPTGLPA